MDYFCCFLNSNVYFSAIHRQLCTYIGMYICQFVDRRKYKNALQINVKRNICLFVSTNRINIMSTVLRCPITRKLVLELIGT